MTSPTMPNSYPPSTITGEVPDAAPRELLHDLESAGVHFDVSAAVRSDHGRDWWPLSIGEVAAGRVPQWPGVVVLAHSTDDVCATLRVASTHRTPVTAQGGRSGVVGGAVAPEGGIALDLTGLNAILDIDEVAGHVRVEAGIFGPELETYLRARGWTVGHFPQSFDLATVGGWIACRGAGQLSNRYGKIEDIVRAMRVVLANGDVIDVGSTAPRRAVGPDLMGLFVGSEGSLGIVTEATLVIRRLARFEQRAAYGFSSFEEGLEACRRILQRDAAPAVLRLYDSTESQRNFDVTSCALIVLDEGEESLVRAGMRIVHEECEGSEVLDDALVERWLTHRNDVGALAPLWEHGVVVDTIEVSGSWTILPQMYHDVVSALTTIQGMLVASVHQSHAYLDGACLYFTFAGRTEGDVTSFYRHAWDVATRAVLDCGGALSHHHGVGRNRARFVAEALGTSMAVLEAMKIELDPLNILNPGVLGLGAAPW